MLGMVVGEDEGSDQLVDLFRNDGGETARSDGSIQGVLRADAVIRG